MHVEDGRHTCPQFWGHGYALQKHCSGTFDVLQCQIASWLTPKYTIHFHNPIIQLWKKLKKKIQVFPPVKTTEHQSSAFEVALISL